MNNTAIVWLRRDLRLEDHYAFSKASQLNARILPIFIFDSDILKNFADKDDRRISFLADRLIYLNSKLKIFHLNITLFSGKAKEIVYLLLKELKPTHIIASAGYEPYDLERDKYIMELCNKLNINFLLENDHLILPPYSIVKADQSPFKIFTPYSKKLYQNINDITIKEKKINLLTPWDIKLSCRLKESIIDLNQDKKILLEKIGYNYVSYKPWKEDFTNLDINKLINKLPTYGHDRNFLSLDGTSKFSVYLRFGFISIRACLRLALSQPNSYTWINELMWRDFYAMVLYFFPECHHKELIDKYRNLKWSYDEDVFKKVVNSQTGYPIIDAAIRQLKEIGWIHNRARMIVASFLSKNLLIDWRQGEKLYAKYLMDYELSSNIGGWQWSASVGFNSQPYFRIFNPYTQSRKFDPEGKYIKIYLPALATVTPKYIHYPQNSPFKINYPEPIIEHDRARKRALLFYRHKEIN